MENLSYSEYYEQLERYLPTGLVEAEKKADAFGLSFAEKHRRDSMHYFFYWSRESMGAVYSYAMCYWENKANFIEIYPCCRVSSRDVRDRRKKQPQSHYF